MYITGFYGQKPEYFQIEPGGVQIQRSVFSDVEVIDTRFDTIYMGFVQKGAFNRKAPVKLSQSMEAELSGVASKLIAGSDRENGTVLINIRNYFLSELTGAVSESGTFIFKAGCYLKENGRYRPMFSVDTIITVRSGLDITKKLLRTANEQVGLLVQKAASFDVAALDPTIAYSLHDIVHIDELEKKLIPVYNTDLPQKGLYASYEDFKHNRPTTTALKLKQCFYQKN